MSIKASDQETRSRSPEGVRRSGCSTRSGEFCTSVIAIPFGQAYPCDSGCCGSGRSCDTRPSETVATSPQWASQMRQKVTFWSVGITSDQFSEALRAVPGDVHVRVLDKLQRRPKQLREPPPVTHRVDERALGLPHDQSGLPEARQPPRGLQRLRDP